MKKDKINTLSHYISLYYYNKYDNFYYIFSIIIIIKTGHPITRTQSVINYNLRIFTINPGGF